MWRDLVISQDFCLTAVLLQLSLYFLLVLQAPPPKSSPNLPKCTLTPDCPRKRELLAKRWQLAIAASRLAVSLATKNFKKILWDQGSTNEPARKLGGLWRLRYFLYSHCSDTLIFFHGMQFLLSSTWKYVVFPGPFQTTLWYPRELFLSNVLLLNCGGGIGTMRDISVETLS